MMTLITRISQDIQVPAKQVAAVLDLLDQGATIPFIARYRKEQTGSLDEVAITRIRDRHQALAALDARKTAILKSLSERDLLTPELEKTGKTSPFIENGSDRITLLETLNRKRRIPMASTRLAGNPISLAGDFPAKGGLAPDFTGVIQDLSEITLDSFKGKRKVLNIFPSIDTDVCATSVRKFNEKAAALENTRVICLSKDLPFALKRFCGAEGIENVVSASLFRDTAFPEKAGVLIMDGPLKGLTARAVLVLDEKNQVVYAQLVDDITHEPDYDAALAAL